MTKKQNLKFSVFPVSEEQHNKNVVKNEHKYDGPVDFETAITQTKFGKFNLIIILAAIPAMITAAFSSTTMSYVFPAAQCDLTLSLEDKGLLNSITYSGMISSAILWGFLSDTLGRKKLLIIGYLLNGCFVILSVFSQSIVLLLISKFMEGSIINGPFAVLTSYLSEFQCSQYRARTQMMAGIIMSFSNLLMPILAWGILPLNMEFSLFNGYLEFHSWNVFLLVSAIPSLLSSVIFMLMPESPKFLMTTGNNEKALNVMKFVYGMNTGRPREDYPVKELVDEIKLTSKEQNNHGGNITANRTKIQALREGFQQMKPLCSKLYLSKILMVCGIQFCLMMGLNTLRLWMPQLFQAVNDYKFENNGSTASLCIMLENIQPSANITECVVNKENSSVYINAIIIGFVGMIVGLIAGTLINKLGKKLLIVGLSMASGVVCGSIYFTRDSISILIIMATFLSLGAICVNVILAVCVDLFPTSLRTMSVSLVMMCGRIGPTVGNLLFPILLESGCAPPFFILGVIMIVPGILAGIFLPNTDLKAMQ